MLGAYSLACYKTRPDPLTHRCLRQQVGSGDPGDPSEQIGLLPIADNHLFA